MANYERFICFFDILGFKTKILAYSFPVKQSVYENIISNYKESINASVVDNKGNVLIANNGDRIIAKQSNIAWFSDSVILYSDVLTDANVESEIFNLLESALRLFVTMLKLKFPVRGAVAIGDFCANPELNIYLGKPLIDAYEFSLKHDWAGATLTADAARYMRERNISTNYLVDYCVPCKSGEVVTFKTLNWASYNEADRRNNITELIIKNAFESNAGNMTWDVKRKLSNTLSFFAQFKSNQNI